MSGHSFTTALLDLSTATAEFAVNWLLQSTLLITVGLLAGVLLRKRGSAAQSVVYRTTLAAVLICPIATWLLAQGGFSGWSLELPAAWAVVESVAATGPAIEPSITVALQNQPIAPIDDRSAESAMISERTGAPAGFEPGMPPQRVDDEIQMPVASETSPVSAESALIAKVGPPAAEVPSLAIFPLGFVAVAFVVTWILVSGALLLRLSIAWWELSRLRRRTILADATSVDICRTLAPQLGVRAPAVLRSPYIQSPCLAGLRHTAILLPEEQIELPIRDVLIHELAHLRRHDCHWKLLHKLASALFFFQPLVWKLSRRIDATSEEVCDDYVMQLGGDRQQYAHGLVDVAELSAAPAAAVGAMGVGIVSLRSMLAHRVARIMDTRRTLSTRVGRMLVVLVLLGGLMGTGVVGLVGLKSRASLAEMPPMVDATPIGAGNDTVASTGADVVASVETNDQIQNVATTSAEKTPARAKEIYGRVLGASGKPVADAKFYWFRTRVHDVDPMTPRLIATTNDRGEFKFIPPAMDASEDEPAGWDFREQIVVKAPGHAFKITSPGALRPGANQSLLDVIAGPTVRLPAAGEPIQGRLVNIDGQPIAGVKVRTRWFSDADDGRHTQAAPAADDELGRWNQRVNYLLNGIEPAPLREVLPQAVTDADGRFTLDDIGLYRLLQLLVEGEGIETTEIVVHNESAEEIQLPPDRQNDRRGRTVYGRQFVHAIGPSHPIEGRVLDIDTGQPLAGAVIRAVMIHGNNLSSSREREEFATRTDAEGRYRIAGLPIGDGNELVAFTTGADPYVAIGHKVDTSAGKETTSMDFRLKRGVWAEGRVFDPESQKPYTGEITYYFFLNPELKKSIAGIYGGFVDGLYWTNSKGEFRIPVLPTRGVLAYRYDGRGPDRDGIDRFPRGSGADLIEGQETYGAYATAPFYLMPGNYERIVAIDPAADEPVLKADIPLLASPPIKVRVVDVDGAAVNKFILDGANERFGWQSMTTAEVTITDLKPKDKRKLFAFDRERNLVGFAMVTYGEKETVRITLQKAGSVIGTIVDPDKTPITDVTLLPNGEKFSEQDDTGMWAPVVNQSVQPTSVSVDNKGRFRLDGLVPGMKYNAHASAPRKMDGQMQSMIIGPALTDVSVAPGEVKDLGLLVVGERENASTESEPATPAADAPVIDPPIVGSVGFNRSRVGEEITVTAGETKDLGDVKLLPLEPAVAANSAAASKEAKGNTVFAKNDEKATPDSSANPQTQLRTLRGRVVNSNDQPVRGAHVAAAAMKMNRVAGGAIDSQGVVLASVDADENGQFSLQFAPISHKTHSAANMIARADGLGLGWAKIDFVPKATDGNLDEFTIKLLPEEPVRARLVDIDGQPCAGVRCDVRTLVVRSKEGLFGQGESIDHRFTGTAPETWVASVTSDNEGRFVLHGVPRGFGAYLAVAGSERFAPQDIALNTGSPEQREEHDGTYRPLVKNAAAGEEAVVALAPAQWFEGVVRYEDTGEPAPNARLKIWASQQQFGSMSSIEAKADENGRYRINPHPGIRFGVTAFPPAGSPYLTRQTPLDKAIHWESGDRVKQVDMSLERGVTLRGAIVDSASGAPVAGASVQYIPESSNNPNASDDIVTGWEGIQTSDEQGAFQIVAPAGPGRLLVHDADGGHILQEIGSEELRKSKPGGQRNYAHAIQKVDLSVDREPDPLTISLQSGATVQGRMIDEQGALVPEALVISPLNIRAFWLTWHGQTEPTFGGKFEITGLAPDKEHLFYFLDAKRRLGAARTIRATDNPLDVVLEPCGEATARFVDPEGQPIKGHRPSLHIILKPGALAYDFDAQQKGALAAVGDFISNVDRTNHMMGPPDGATDAEGRIAFRALIPGASYQLMDVKNGKMVAGREFKITANQKLDLGDITNERQQK